MLLESKITSPPTQLPVSTAQLRHYMASSLSSGEVVEEDTFLETLIIAATRILQRYTNLSFITQTITLQAREVVSELQLLYSPIQSITSVELIASDGSKTATSDYVVMGLDHQSLVFDQIISTTGVQTLYDLEVVYVAGYGDSFDDMPEEVSLAILKQCVVDYEYREENKEIALNVISNDARSTIASLSRNKVHW